MPRNERNRQAKLLKKRRKEKEKKRRAASAVAGISEKSVVRRANRYPLHECLINRNWREEGMANIVVVRRQSENSVAFGAFLVDLYCLGVKGTFCRADLPMSKYTDEFRAQFLEKNDGTVCPAELAHQIIYGGLAYAASLDLTPHHSFQLSRNLLESPETVPPNPDLKFGREGKPFFVAGPHDHSKRIVKHLQDRLGPDGFHFLAEQSTWDRHGDVDE